MPEDKKSGLVWVVVVALVILLGLIAWWRFSPKSEPVPQGSETVEESQTEQLAAENTGVEGEMNPEEQPQVIPDIIPGVINLTCDNNYSAKALYYNPDAAGVMQNLTLEITQPGLVYEHAMAPVPSGSGAKFATYDGSFWWWEHQGEYTFGDASDQTLAVCHPQAS